MVCVFSDSRFMWNYTGAGSAVISVQQQFTESPYHETESDIAVKLSLRDQRNGRCSENVLHLPHQNQLFVLCEWHKTQIVSVSCRGSMPGIFPLSGKFHFFPSICLSLRLRTGLTRSENINMSECGNIRWFLGQIHITIHRRINMLAFLNSDIWVRLGVKHLGWQQKQKQMLV